MEKPESIQFLELYQTYRSSEQLKFYRKRQQEFSRAQNQAMAFSITLIFLAALAAAFEALAVPWLHETCLLAAAICPILATALTAYNALYAFEQQAKIYEDTAHNLEKLRAQEFLLQQNRQKETFPEQLRAYVQDVEQILQIEHGQWGQLAKSMKPPEV
jgi:hypothetical protein